MKKRPNKMISYLAVTAGVGCVSSAANAAVVFYGINSANDTNANPAGIAVGTIGFAGYLDTGNSSASRFLIGTVIGSSSQVFLTRGVDLLGTSSTTNGQYSGIDFGTFNAIRYGGVEAGRNNYANVSFNGDDGIYEAVAQFDLKITGGGFLVAIARNENGAALPISQGKAMIDAAAVPEPSGLVLLALGATGLAARRQRRKAA